MLLRNQYVPCCLAPCHFRHCIAWSHFDLLNHCTPPESHEIFKTHRIIIIFIFFMGNYVAFKNYTNNFKLFHKFHKKSIFINCKNFYHLRNGISTWNESPKRSLILYYTWWGLCWFLPSFVKTFFLRVCMSSGSNRGLCDTVVDSQRTKFLKVSIRLLKIVFYKFYRFSSILFLVNLKIKITKNGLLQNL